MTVDDDACIYLIGYKPLKRLIGVLISSDFKRKVNSEGYIDVGDGCWRRNVWVGQQWWQLEDVGNGFAFFDHQHPLSALLASDTNIQKVSPT